MDHPSRLPDSCLIPDLRLGGEKRWCAGNRRTGRAGASPGPRRARSGNGTERPRDRVVPSRATARQWSGGTRDIELVDWERRALCFEVVFAGRPPQPGDRGRSDSRTGRHPVQNRPVQNRPAQNRPAQNHRDRTHQDLAPLASSTRSGIWRSGTTTPLGASPFWAATTAASSPAPPGASHSHRAPTIPWNASFMS
jgi:hypothetical protein